MGTHWIEAVQRLTVGQTPRAAEKSAERTRKARKESLIRRVTVSYEWDLSLSDGDLGVIARNRIASYAVEMRLSEPEIQDMAHDVVWNVRFPSVSTEA